VKKLTTSHLLETQLFEDSEILELAQLRMRIELGLHSEWLTDSEQQQLAFLKWRVERGEFLAEGH